jgi:S1-C subfamily serine protease
MRLAAGVLAAAALLAPTVAAAPPRAPLTVTVTVHHRTGPPDEATGFVAGDGRVMTVAHVLGESAGPVTGRTGDAAVFAAGRRARVVRFDRRLDLALLAVPGIEGAAPPLGGGGDTRIVTPAGSRPAPIVRRISARVDGIQRPALELRADVVAGESGAPVVTASGRVAGVVFASSERRRVAYAVDLSG